MTSSTSDPGRPSRLFTLPAWPQVRGAVADSALVGLGALLTYWLAWRQPILRLADTVIGVAVGLAAVWLAQRARSRAR
jgi:hypothetical protein